MAIDLINNKEDEDKNKVGAAGSPAPQAQEQSSESVYAGGGGRVGPQTQAQPQGGAARRGGTGFTNLSRIVNANKSNKLGGAIGGGIQRTVGDVKQGLNQATQGFQQKAQEQQQGLAQNRNLVNQAIQRYGYVGNEPAQGPSEEEIARFQDIQNAQYQGPQSLENEQELLAKSRTAEALGQAAGSQEGRLNLLNRFVGGKGYTTGQRRLDNLLLGQSAGTALKEARRESMGLGDKASTEAQVAKLKAQGLAGDVTALGQEATGQLTTAAQEYANKLAERQKAAQQEYARQYADIKAQLESGEITQETADRLGLKANEYTYGFDPAKILTAMDQGNIGLANVTSADEAAKIQALQKLGGGRIAGQAGNLFNEYRDPSQVGTAKDLNIYNEFDRSADDYQKGLQSSRAGIEAGGAWQGAQRRLSESTGALQGLSAYDAANTELQNFNATTGKSLSDNLSQLGIGGFDYVQNSAARAQDLIDPNKNPKVAEYKRTIDAVNSGQYRPIKDAKGNVTGYSTGTGSLSIADYNKAKAGMDAVAQTQNYINQRKALDAKHRQAEAQAYFGGPTMRDRAFETQKQAEAQKEIDAMRGKQIKIKQGSNLPKLGEFLNRK